MTTLTITQDTVDLLHAAEKLATLSAEDFGKQVLKAVNETATRADEAAMGRMLAGVNITKEQVEKRKEIRLATDAALPVASIIVKKSRATLASFGASETPVPVNWSNARISALGKTTVRADPARRKGNPLKQRIWTERVGVPGVGIAPDFKRSGITAEVLKGVPKPLAHAFLIKKNGILVAMKRRSNGTVTSASALAPYQLFKHALAPDFLEKVSDDLAKSIGESFDNQLRNLL